MARMILDCSACSSQNYVSRERRLVRDVPPRCWMCGETLPLPDETDPLSVESKKRTGKENVRGRRGNG